MQAMEKASYLHFTCTHFYLGTLKHKNKLLGAIIKVIIITTSRYTTRDTFPLALIGLPNKSLLKLLHMKLLSIQIFISLPPLVNPIFWEQIFTLTLG